MEAEIICSWSKLNVIKKDEIIIDLERSEYVKKRKEYLKKLKIPTISEVKDILGPDIARIIFLQCPSEQKVLLGLIPPLEGPGDTLWSSPSDLLIGKVCLKPPLTSKYMRALTHQGILEIGHEIEKKYWNQMELVKDCALGQQKADLLYNFEKELKKALVCLGVRLHEECNMKIAALTLQFEIQLAEMLRLQEEMLRAQFNAQLSELEDELKKQEEKCNKAIQEAVDRAVKEATKLFLNDLDKQHEILCEYFGAEIKRFEIQKNFELQMKHNKMVQIFKNIKHHLECRNMANMMYILCMERRKCVKEKCEIEDCYKKEINRLEEVVDKQTNDIKRLKTERHFKTQEVQLREKCIVEILAQFQKFINFALKASPTQAEFLLSLEKLMVFELAQSIEKTKVPKPKPEPPLQRWKKGKDDESEIRSLTVKDFHDCFNEVDPPLKFKEMDADTPLPAMYLNKHLYVREDFRDMIAAGVKISKHNELWSQDVEIVVKKMKEFAYEEPPADEEESEKETKPKKSALKTFKRTEPLNVNFDLSDKEIPLGEEDSVQMDESTTDVTECERKYKIAQPCRPMGISKISDMRKVTNFVDYAKIGEQDEKKTLISTKDSKDIYKTTLEHIYTGPMQDLTEESEICDITIESDDQFSMTDYLRWLQEGDDGENKRPMPMIKHKKKLGLIIFFDA
ncbi:unnamed protein product [Brassicogethes aeneus]|uniref:Uncharacterized protein n=1 Tax=Brassicogethes aeneus TaxID=1431903 RepID=A0A9P0B5L5_BRAAE|nr:unnamed protein product [Brassicogethes aeneus]